MHCSHHPNAPVGISIAPFPGVKRDFFIHTDIDTHAQIVFHQINKSKRLKVPDVQCINDRKFVIMDRMSIKFTRIFQVFFIAGAALMASAATMYAQVTPELRLQLDAGRANVTVTGEVGAQYVLQYVSELSCTGGWVCFTNVTLASNLQLWTDQTAADAAQRFYRAVVVSTNMAFVPAGTFDMGDAFSEGDSDESPVHTVEVSAFLIDRSLVKKELWLDILTWAGTHGYMLGNGSYKTANHPVHTVSWHDAVKWCNARSEKEGLTPCYYTDASQAVAYRSGTNDLSSACVKWKADGYRLPTEAEWEKAARGGLKRNRFPWGDTLTQSQANYYSRSNDPYDLNTTRGYHPAFNNGTLPYTSPVGYFSANGYGLNDMAGNLWQWCWDRYDSGWYSATGAIQADTRGPASGNNRTLRGGYWGDYASKARTANRSPFLAPSSSSTFVGFRCVRGL